MDQSGREWTEANQIGLKWTEMDLSELNGPKYYVNIAQKHSNKNIMLQFLNITI